MIELINEELSVAAKHRISNLALVAYLLFLNSSLGRHRVSLYLNRRTFNFCKPLLGLNSDLEINMIRITALTEGDFS